MFLTALSTGGDNITINVALISHFYPGFDIKWRGELRPTTAVFVNGHELRLLISSDDLIQNLARWRLN